MEFGFYHPTTTGNFVEWVSFFETQKSTVGKVILSIMIPNSIIIFIRFGRWFFIRTKENYSDRKNICPLHDAGIQYFMIDFASAKSVTSVLFRVLQIVIHHLYIYIPFKFFSRFIFLFRSLSVFSFIYIFDRISCTKVINESVP